MKWLFPFLLLAGCSVPTSGGLKIVQSPKARVSMTMAMEVLPPKPWLIWTQPPDPRGWPVVNDVESRPSLLSGTWTCIASNLTVRFWPVQMNQPAEFFRVGAHYP